MSRLDGTDGLEESSARQRLWQSQCRVGWSPPISRTPPGFELSAPFVFLDTTASKLLICGLFPKGRVLAQDGTGCGELCLLFIRPRAPNLIGLRSAGHAPQKVYPALIAQFRSTMVGCF